MEGRLQCGSEPSDSVDIGYERGFLADIVVLGLGFLTVSSSVLRYPRWFQKRGDPMWILRAAVVTQQNSSNRNNSGERHAVPLPQKVGKKGTARERAND